MAEQLGLLTMIHLPLAPMMWILSCEEVISASLQNISGSTNKCLLVSEIMYGETPDGLLPPVKAGNIAI